MPPLAAPSTSLLVVDAQRGFTELCPAELPVPGGIATNICCFFAARDLRRAGFDVWMAEDAGAGIDVPAAGLFRAKAKAEGQSLGIRYATVAEVAQAVKQDS